jgi:hypothetical protein
MAIPLQSCKFPWIGTLISSNMGGDQCANHWQQRQHPLLHYVRKEHALEKFLHRKMNSHNFVKRSKPYGPEKCLLLFKLRTLGASRAA